MTYFISGGAKCGKSSLAQDLSVALSKGGKHYYVATLIPSGREDDDRIKKHLADREGMGFETVECFRNILDCLETADKNGAFLVDSVTSLIQNSLFPVEKNYEMDLAGANRCADELIEFAKTVRHAVFANSINPKIISFNHHKTCFTLTKFTCKKVNTPTIKKH